MLRIVRGADFPLSVTPRFFFPDDVHGDALFFF